MAEIAKELNMSPTAVKRVLMYGWGWEDQFRANVLSTTHGRVDVANEPNWKVKEWG